MAEFHGSAEIRAEFEKRFGRGVDDDTWQKLLATEYGDPEEDCVREPDPTGVTNRMLEFAAILSAKTSGAVEVAPPASWDRFWRTRVLPNFRDDQLRCLGAFGLHAPIAPSDVASFISDAARSLCERMGMAPNDSNAENLNLKVRAIENDRTTAKTVWFPYETNSALLFLRETVTALRTQNPGISEEDAVGYLLADVPFSSTWLRARCDFWGHVHLTVGSLEVRPEEVAAAYASARRNYLRRIEEEAEEFDKLWGLVGARGWLTRDYRRSADDHTDLIEFMNARMESGAARRAAAQAWKDEHPDDPRKVDSLTRTYLRYATKGVL